MKTFLFLVMTYMVSLASFASSPSPEVADKHSIMVVDVDHSPVFLVAPFCFEIPVQNVDRGIFIVCGSGSSGHLMPEALVSGFDCLVVDPGSGKSPFLSDSAVPKTLEELVLAIALERIDPFPITCFVSPNEYNFESTLWKFEGQLNKDPKNYKSYTGDVYRGERAYLSKK